MDAGVNRSPQLVAGVTPRAFLVARRRPIGRIPGALAALASAIATVGWRRRISERGPDRHAKRNAREHARDRLPRGNLHPGSPPSRAQISGATESVRTRQITPMRPLDYSALAQSGQPIPQFTHPKVAMSRRSPTVCDLPVRCQQRDDHERCQRNQNVNKAAEDVPA
jgi:hypothetical protein